MIDAAGTFGFEGPTEIAEEGEEVSLYLAGVRADDDPADAGLEGGGGGFHDFVFGALDVAVYQIDRG